MKLRKIILLILTIHLASSVVTAQGDSLKVHKSVSDYFAAISTERPEMINGQIDLMINMVENPERKSMLAGLAFDWFSRSPIMGNESVAVHVADEWFLNGKLKWQDGSTYPLLFAYAQINRQSLIGMELPASTMESLEGGFISFREEAYGLKLFYFYDDKCATCAEETPKLVELLQKYEGIPVSLYAIYTQNDREAWQKYVSESFTSISNPNVKVFNLWDPQDENDFKMKYGVSSTPSMLLVDEQNIIIGRRLESGNLYKMLGVKNESSAEIHNLIDNLFAPLTPADSDDVEMIASALAFKFKDDRQLFRDTFQVLYDYLRRSNQRVLQEGAVFIADKYILGQPELWSEDYLEKVAEAVRRYHLNPLGSKAPDLKLFTAGGVKKRLLAGKSGYTVLFFHLVSCAECRKQYSELKRIAPMLKEKGVKVVCVYAGPFADEMRQFTKGLPRKWVSLWDKKGDSAMDEAYDLLPVPRVILLDKEKITIAKDIDVQHLERIIQEL